MIAEVKLFAGILMLLFLLGVCPVCVGALLTKRTVNEWSNNFIYVYMLGLMLLVAITELISVPLTLIKTSFSLYTAIYNGILLILMLLAVLFARGEYSPLAGLLLEAMYLRSAKVFRE